MTEVKGTNGHLLYKVEIVDGEIEIITYVRWITARVFSRQPRNDLATAEALRDALTTEIEKLKQQKQKQTDNRNMHSAFAKLMVDNEDKIG